jgi:hypothetical protein
MRLIIRTDGVELAGASEFGSFAAATDLQPGRLRDAVAGLGIGRLDPDGRHLWVEPRVIEAAAAEPSDAWAEGFTAMCGYAAAHGWTDVEGRIRAHLVATAPAAGEPTGAPLAP